MESETTQKVAVVVGATSGIGLAIAKNLCNRGWLVVGMGRTASDTLISDARSQLGSYLSISVDVTDPDSVSRSFSAVETVLGKLDLLVCSAGMAKLGGIETSPADFAKLIAVNLTGSFYLLHFASELLKKSKGHVIILGSRAARGSFTNVLGYGAAKAGLHYLAQTAAREWSEAGVTLHVVSPSAVSTPMRRGIFPRENPEGCLSPEQIADLCASLLSNEFKITTGSIIDVEF